PPTASSVVFDGNRREALRRREVRACETSRGVPREVAVGATKPTVGLGDARGPPGVRLFAYPNVERQLAAQLHAVLLGPAPSAARADDMLFVAALRTDVSAHVLHDAEHRHFDLLEHAQALARIEQRDVLRGRDDHGAAQGHALRKRELRVAGTGWHVDDQIIEIAPLRR